MKTIRKHFPQLKNLIYLDSAATSLKPQSVIDAISRFYERNYATVHRAIYHNCAKATLSYNIVREKVANFIGAQSEHEVIFTRGTTDSINLVAQSFGLFLKPGDEIIISEMEHHSNIVPWQMLCQRTGAKLKVIQITETGELDLEDYAELLNDRTRMVALAFVANTTGTINPIKTITKMAHEYGAKVLVDAAQAASHIPIDVQVLGVDFLAFSGHKCFGPTGVGILWGREDLLDKMAPVQGGGDMIETVTLEESTYTRAPLKFEAGTPPIAQVIGLGAAIDYILGLGLEEIAHYEEKLLSYATKKLLKIDGLQIIGTAPTKSAIITFVIQGCHPLDIATHLDLKRIAIRSGHHCAQPLHRRFGYTASNRVSLAPFNTREEIDQLAQAIEEAIAQMLGAQY